MKDIDLNVLSSFFKNPTFVSSAVDYCEINRSDMNGSDVKDPPSPAKFTVTLNNAPCFRTDKEIKSHYQNSNYEKIKEVESKANDDLVPLFQNIKDNGKDAWYLIESEGEKLWVSSTDKATLFAYPEQKVRTPVAGETEYVTIVHFGTYSTSGGILGIQSYNITSVTNVVISSIAMAIALFVSKILIGSVEGIAEAIGATLTEAFAAVGLESVIVTVPALAVSMIAGAVVALVLFIGITYLWNWLHKKFVIRLQILNWDKEKTWTIYDNYLSNAKLSGNTSTDSIAWSLPPVTAKGGSITPPGFIPSTSLSEICYRADIAWENKKTFAEGCSMALSIGQSPDEGFTWAFSCPWVESNQQAAINTIVKAKEYREKVAWNKAPKAFGITAAGKPVHFSVDALKGHNDNYSIIINIDK